MKTTLLALLASCLTLSLHATSSDNFGELPVAQVPATVAANGDNVTPGTSRVMVSARLGSPTAVLADGSWLYSGYTANVNGQETGRSATLVVRFKTDRVSSLSLADQATVVALRQMPRHPAGDRILTAVEKRH